MIQNSQLMNRSFSKPPADVPAYRHACDGIYIRHKDYFRKFLYADLLWVKANGCYCDLHFRNKSRLTVAFPLSIVERKLPADLFVRIHHSYVVSLYEITTFFGNTARIGQQDFSIGPAYRAGFLSRLNILNTPRPLSSKRNDDSATD